MPVKFCDCGREPTAKNAVKTRENAGVRFGSGESGTSSRIKPSVTLTVFSSYLRDDFRPRKRDALDRSCASRSQSKRRIACEGWSPVSSLRRCLFQCRVPPPRLALRHSVLSLSSVPSPADTAAWRNVNKPEEVNRLPNALRGPTRMEPLDWAIGCPNRPQGTIRLSASLAKPRTPARRPRRARMPPNST